MKKTMARILALICTLGTLFLVFQARVISPVQGEHVFIYSVPGTSGIGASAGSDLKQQMQEKFGEETKDLDLGPVAWWDQDARIQESMTFIIDDLGRDIHGSYYALCTAETRRTIVGEDGKPLDIQVRTMSYMAKDGAPGTGERAQILWDTELVDYSEHQSNFDALAGNGGKT